MNIPLITDVTMAPIATLSYSESFMEDLSKKLPYTFHMDLPHKDNVPFEVDVVKLILEDKSYTSITISEFLYDIFDPSSLENLIGLKLDELRT